MDLYIMSITYWKAMDEAKAIVMMENGMENSQYVNRNNGPE